MIHQKHAETINVLLIVVKPGDEQPMFPKIPTNLDELGPAVMDLFTSAKETISNHFTKSDK